jgi:two-component system sensor histidine kinase AtoS
VLSNLLANALAATPQGGEIRVEASLLPGGDGQGVEITVADTGSGLNQEVKEHLFEKYFFDREKSGSSGLGLYICKTLVEANHGRIWVESEAGRGTTFHLVFPVE